MLIISPALLKKLFETAGDVPRKLDAAQAGTAELERTSCNESSFRFAFNEDAMATEKTAEDIRGFSADIVQLEKLITAKLG